MLAIARKIKFRRVHGIPVGEREWICGSCKMFVFVSRPLMDRGRKLFDLKM